MFNVKEPEKLSAICKSLGLDSLPPELLEDIEQAANNYLDEVEWAGFLPTRAEKREMLDSLKEQSASYIKVLRQLDSETIRMLEAHGANRLPIEECESLAKASDDILRGYKARGKDPATARLYLVTRLAAIFQTATGHPPTRHHDPKSGLDKGPFLNFVRAILGFIDPDARKGIEHVIREALASKEQREY